MKDLPHPSLHRSWVEIDVSAIADNVRHYRRLVGPDRLIMPAVKANGYGHGAVMAARAALAGGADRLAVATCREGQELRDAGIGVPIQILGAMLPEEVSPAVKYNLTISLHDIDIARLAALEAADGDAIAPVHLKIDTGMGRLGVAPEKAAAAAAYVARLPGLRLEGVFMHFADPADEQYSRFQLGRFAKARQAIRDAGVGGFLVHAASSDAAVLYPESYFDMIRPGAGIYGYLSPSWIREGVPLRHVMTWKSAVIQLKDYPAGSNLGYSRTFTTRRPTRVAVLPLGYADGYRREFSNKAQVLIRGRRAPVVGIVSMDYAMVDVTDLDDIEVGAVATLLGPDRDDVISTEEMAEWGGTIPYCITTGIGGRVGRLYVGEVGE